MESVAKDITDIYLEIQDLFAFVSNYVNNPQIISNIKFYMESSTVKNYDQAKKVLDGLYKVYEIITFVISEKDGAAQEIVEMSYFKNIKLGEILKKLDLIAHRLYTMAKKNPELETKAEKVIRSTTDITKLAKHFGIETDTFAFLNPEFLFPTEEICLSANLPTGAKQVSIRIKNTQNLISTVKTLIDNNYVKEHYSNTTPTSGVSAETIERYSVLKEYPDVEQETSIIGLEDKEIYQKLDKNTFRKLTHYSENDYVRNYDFLPYNVQITNFENKRITMAKQYMPKNSLYKAISGSEIGSIKNNFVNKNQRMADAFFNGLYHENMTDEQVIKLGVAAYTFQQSLPDNKKIVIDTFPKFVNKRALRNAL